MPPSQKTVRRIKTIIGWGSAAYCGYKALSGLLYAAKGEHTTKALCDGRAAPAAQPHSHLFSRSYFQNKDGLYIFWRKWEPPAGKNNGQYVVLVHGLGEHIGRYENVAAALTASGFTVFGLDHQGHGHSEGDPMFMNSIMDLSDEVIQLRRELVPTSGRKAKVFLLGHSMGGCVSMITAMRSPELWDGICLSAPLFMLDPKVATPVNKFLANLVSNILPKIPIDKMPEGKISRTPAVALQYKLDPLNNGSYPVVARLGAQLMSGMDFIAERMASFNLPFLIQHGTADGLVLIDGTHRFHESAKSSDKTKLIYEGWYHEIYNECETDCFIETDPKTGVTTNVALRDAVAWMVKRV